MSIPLSSIKIIIPYFGHWPEWINLFMQSCQYNSTINWLFVTDCGYPDIQAENVEFLNISFEEYQIFISEQLNINFSQVAPYKLCDLRPAYGFIHQHELNGYDFYGFGDIDLIYGNLRHFLTEDILQQYQIISTHNTRISGHFCLFKNIPLMLTAFRRIPGWKKMFENPRPMSIDESKFTKIFIPHRKHPPWLKKLYGLCSPYWRNNYFKEQFSTILSPMPWLDGSREHPQYWLWNRGKLTNTKDYKREFMYLHFMNWKSSLWLHQEVANKAAWENLDRLVLFDHRHPPEKWAITPEGFKKAL